MTRLSTDESHHKRCEECGRRITVGSNDVEYGHEAGRSRASDSRCSRRPGCVDARPKAAAEQEPVPKNSLTAMEYPPELIDDDLDDGDRAGEEVAA